MQQYPSVESVAAAFAPEHPLHLFRPAAIAQAVSYFTEHFPGNVMFAVKTNPQAHALAALAEAGITRFDVASLQEVQAVHGQFPDAEMYFMHTVKSRRAIAAAYHDYGVRRFSLDSEDELAKILQETNNATDLELFVRLAIPNTYAEMNLADKFGTVLDEAPGLLQQVRQHTKKLGVSFHVGSQCMHPDAYRIAMRMASKVIREAEVPVEVMDVGGGFPSIYPGMHPPALSTYFDAIAQEWDMIAESNLAQELLCEPGRALVAESGSVLVRVELRKGQNLYINDGTYGSLFDAGTPKFIFPTQHIPAIKVAEGEGYNQAPFSFFGPTCDTLDFMKGPFYLPEDIEEGDYIEIGQLGAYGRTLATAFNGFGPEAETVIVNDAPLMSMYREAEEEPMLAVA